MDGPGSQQGSILVFELFRGNTNKLRHFCRICRTTVISYRNSPKNYDPDPDK
jgi:hypothetical protein